MNAEDQFDVTMIRAGAFSDGKLSLSQTWEEICWKSPAATKP